MVIRHFSFKFIFITKNEKKYYNKIDLYMLLAKNNLGKMKDKFLLLIHYI